MGKYGSRHPLEVACQKLAAARDDLDQLTLLRKWLSACERENASLDERAAGVKQLEPCWKWLHDDGGFAAGGEDEAEWCTPCQLREAMRPAYRASVMAYGHAKTAFWSTVRSVARYQGWVGTSGRLTLTEMQARDRASR